MNIKAHVAVLSIIALSAAVGVFAQNKAPHAGEGSLSGRSTPVVAPNNNNGRVKAKVKLMGLERSKDSIDIEVPNPSEEPLKVFGVQSSPSLFVVDFDKKIPAGKAGKVTVSYESQFASTGGNEYLRLKTSNGVQLIDVKIDRPQVVQFSEQQLVWKEGSLPTPQSVTVDIARNDSRIRAVQALGVGNTAALVDLGKGHYRIDITPASTAANAGFPVLIEFDPEIPDAPRAVICSIK